MLLTIPRIKKDFRGGSSLLGLGDIVLPGLLISFAARLVEATFLVWHGHANTFVSSGDAATAAESSEDANQQSAQSYPQMREPQGVTRSRPLLSTSLVTDCEDFQYPSILSRRLHYWTECGLSIRSRHWH